jgi:hypothetical protein
MTDLLLVNGIEIDLKEGSAVPLNFSIADAKEPQSRKRNFSKEITLQGTQRNLNFFSSTYQLDLTSLNGLALEGFRFDTTQRTSCLYYKGGFEVFRGMFQLKEVVIINGNYEFKCQLYTDIIDLYQTLKDITCDELGWEEYTHTLNLTNVGNSFDTSVILNGVATNNFTAGNPDGFGYIYGLAEYGYNRSNPTHFALNQLAPLIYVRETFLKCLDILGLTHDSTFLDSQRFKNLIWGFGGGKPFELTSGEIANRLVTIDSNGGGGDITSGQYPMSFAGVGEINQDLLNFDLVGGVGAIITDASTQLTIPTDGTQAFITVGATGNYRINWTQDLIFSEDSDATFTQLTSIPTQNYQILVNGVVRVTRSLSLNGFGTYSYNPVDDLSLNAGDVVTMRIIMVFTYQASGGTYYSLRLGYDGIIQDYQLSFSSIDTELIEGSTINISRAIPKIKASDFFAGVIKMFNLYFGEPDENGVVKIEPFSDYYEPTDTFDDWTDLVDLSKEIRIKPTSTIEGRRYLFEFEEDNDYYNKKYREDWGENYGNRDLDVPSPFQVGDKIYKLPFSHGIPTDIIAGFVIPTIINIDPATNQVIPFKGKPKIYQYNGMKSGNWRLTNVIDPTITFTNYTTYPSLHHFDDWENPTFDLNFKLPRELYYTTTDFTNTNIWSEYIEQFIRDLISRDSKILELYVRLNADKIANLRFERLKMINGVLYRLNEVMDWDSNITESTKVELLKIV